MGGGVGGAAGTPARLGTREGVVPVGVGQELRSTSELHRPGAAAPGQSRTLESGLWCPHPRGSHQAGPRSSYGPPGGLVTADLGIPNGTPNIKNELIGEGEVTKPLIQGLGQLIRVPLVLPKFYHGGR